MKQRLTFFVKFLLQDVITDLNAEGEPIPINPPKEDWIGHKVSGKQWERMASTQR